MTMENKSRELPTPTRTSFGPLKEARNLRVNGSASIEELKEFLGSLKGKSPQEVIGLVSSSMLIQSLSIATVATLIFFVIFTVGPYIVYGPLKPTNLSGKPVEKKAASEQAASPSKAAPATAAEEKAEPTESEKAAKVLGIDEVKNADPKKNPLDKGPNIDNLLDGLDK